MPKVDPVTGCTVLTMPEALDRMAESEGKGRSGWEIYGEIVDEMSADSRRMEEEFSTPEGAMEIIKSGLRDTKDYWEDIYGKGAVPPVITEVVNVIEVNCSQSFRDSGGNLIAEVRTENGDLCYVTYTHSYWSGTMLEPPESDTEFYIGKFEPITKRPWKCYVCGKDHEKGQRHWTHIEQSDNPKMVVHECPKCNGYERRQWEKKRRKLLRRGR